MGKKIFVGNLSWDTDDQSLFQAFSRFGAIVEAKVITDRNTGRSRGFGFVTFEEERSAEEAIEEMEDSQLDGRAIKVNEAQERAPRGDRGG